MQGQRACPAKSGALNVKGHILFRLHKSLLENAINILHFWFQARSKNNLSLSKKTIYFLSFTQWLLKPLSCHSLIMSGFTTKEKWLDEAFYQHTDVVAVAKSLLGKYIITQFDGRATAGKIVETEAYRGPDDKACHAYNNRRTPRTEVMYEPGGVSYVYLCYGIHHLFNVVTGRAEMPHAVLIRAIEPTHNIPLMLQRRNRHQLSPQLTAGPGVLSTALGIHTRHTGLSLTRPESPIRIANRGCLLTDDIIIASPRVGVGYAQECALWNWRFRIKGSKWCSPAK